MTVLVDSASDDAAAAPVPRLSKHQVQDLKRLGVLDEQIMLLDQAVELVSPLIRKVARLQDVRDELDSLETVLRLAQARAQRLSDGPALKPAEREARDRIREGSIATGGDGESMQRVITPLYHALQAVRSAQVELPTDQRRGTNAQNWSPIRWIHQALVLGWKKAHEARSRHTNLGRHLPLRPPFSFNPSRSPNSKFRKIADICYGAMRDDQEGNAESAIKAYQAWRQREPGAMPDL